MLSAQYKYSSAIRFITLIAVAWLAQTGWPCGCAWASCGDYVTVGGVRGHLTLESQLAHSSPSDPSGLPVCSGAHCQRSVPLPATPKQTFQSGPHESAHSRAEAVFRRPERSMLISEPTLLASQAVIVPPDRPPRAFCIRAPRFAIHAHVVPDHVRGLLTRRHPQPGAPLR